MSKQHVRFDIITGLSVYWDHHPNMRFTQLIQLIAGKDDPYYMNDRDFLNALNASLCDDQVEAEEVAKLYAAHRSANLQR